MKPKKHDATAETESHWTKHSLQEKNEGILKGSILYKQQRVECYFQVFFLAPFFALPFGAGFCLPGPTFFSIFALLDRLFFLLVGSSSSSEE